MTACATLRASRPAGRRLLAERIWSHMWRLDELAEGPGRARSTCCVTTTRCRASDAAMDARDLSFYLYSLFKAGALARVCGGLQTDGSTPWGRKMGRRRCRGDHRWRDDTREPYPWIKLSSLPATGFWWYTPIRFGEQGRKLAPKKNSKEKKKIIRLM